MLLVAVGPQHRGELVVRAGPVDVAHRVAQQPEAVLDLGVVVQLDGLGQCVVPEVVQRDVAGRVPELLVVGEGRAARVPQVHLPAGRGGHVDTQLLGDQPERVDRGLVEPRAELGALEVGLPADLGPPDPDLAVRGERLVVAPRAHEVPADLGDPQVDRRLLRLVPVGTGRD